jgi:hypothetical protein
LSLEYEIENGFRQSASGNDQGRNVINQPYAYVRPTFSLSMSILGMQRPTCSNIRIRSTNDAHKIFLAVKQGVLQMVTRRLDADERLALW